MFLLFINVKISHKILIQFVIEVVGTLGSLILVKVIGIFISLRLANMQRPQTAPSRQYREMQTMVETLKDEKESLMQRYDS